MEHSSFSEEVTDIKPGQRQSTSLLLAPTWFPFAHLRDLLIPAGPVSRSNHTDGAPEKVVKLKLMVSALQRAKRARLVPNGW